MRSQQEKLADIERVLLMLRAEPSLSEATACRAAGIPQANFSRWRKTLVEKGREALEPQTFRSGRKRLFEFTPESKAKFQSTYLQTNANSESGSMTMAAHIIAGSDDALEEALSRRRSKHSLPTAVIEAAQEVRALTALHRQGDRGLRTATFQPGKMRLAPGNGRRLYAGEQQSWDDGTVNFGVAVPWPWGGCPASDKYGYKLGRFQLLLCHDDATSYIPSWTYVVRPAQSYRGAETAGAILRAARDTGIPDRIVLEGGVWQGKRVMETLSTLGINWVDAKGNPQRKLVENFFNRLWSRLALEPGQVGRYRGEMKREGDIYTACQAGRKNPYEHFCTLEEALAAMEKAIAFLNTYPVESREYGSWIPQVRWMQDLAEQPRPSLQGDWLYLASPVAEERIVSRGMVRVTADGPFGISTKWHFAHPNLWQFDKQSVRVHFDPQGEQPVQATIVLAKDYAGEKAGTILCEAESIDPMTDGSPDSAKEINKALRSAMRREYRALLPDSRTGQQRIVRRESEARGMGGYSHISRGGDDSTPCRYEDATAATPGEFSRQESGTPAEEVALRGERRSFAGAATPRRNTRSFTPDPTDDDLAQMKRLEREAIQRGDLIIT